MARLMVTASPWLIESFNATNFNNEQEALFMKKLLSANLNGSLILTQRDFEVLGKEGIHQLLECANELKDTQDNSILRFISSPSNIEEEQLQSLVDSLTSLNIRDKLLSNKGKARAD